MSDRFGPSTHESTSTRFSDDRVDDRVDERRTFDDRAPDHGRGLGDQRGVDQRGVDQRGVDAPAGGRGAGHGDQPVTLIDPRRAEEFQLRWKELKGDFVDEPKHAVRQANALVGEVLDALEELFRNQRSEFERGLNDDQTSTEDLRVALGRYRSFFDRLLSF